MLDDYFNQDLTRSVEICRDLTLQQGDYALYTQYITIYYTLAHI